MILSSEFGALLQNFDKSHNNDFKATMTAFFDVPSTFRYKTKTQGDLILKEPCFSICGVSTLPWIMQNFKDSDVTSGFFARFLFFCPPFQNDIPPALPERKNPPNPRIEEKFNDILDVLNGIGSISYTISEGAKRLFEEIHNDIHKMQRSYNDQSQGLLDPFVKRWSPYILKIAMIMQYFINPLDNKIGAEAIRAASSFILVAIKSTAQLFEGELGESEEQRNCRKLFTWICHRIEVTSGKPVKRQEIFASRQIKAEKGRSDNIGYTQALKMLCESGQLDENQKPGGKPVDNKNYWEYVPKEIIRG